MKNHSSCFCVDQMAKILGVSRSGYYDFINHMPSKRAEYNEELISKIKYNGTQKLDKKIEKSRYNIS